MKNTSKLIILIILSSNIFANSINVETNMDINISVNKNKKTIKSFLLKRGIEETKINNIIKELPKNYEKRVIQLTKNIKFKFPNIEIDKINKILTNDLLTKNYSLYESYDEKIGLLQRVYKVNLSKRDMEKIEYL